MFLFFLCLACCKILGIFVRVAEEFVSPTEVGDGDLSFSLALAHAWRAEKSTAELVATVYDSREELLRALELQKARGNAATSLVRDAKAL